ncbi:hypothetical protein RUM8411_02670 [Ruegeria meonggei]|uniref:DUF1989 domain-containing protein n=1 Tax=Ruegeria meonggei TaxID=1446476 RepID=A0A1X6ZLN7_9RHOB|nr:hypothetical protein RUM8411_02670 [Ruegeria meonggei]
MRLREKGDELGHLLVGQPLMIAHPPVSRSGDFIELTALADLIICLSACPQDLADTNGTEREPRDAEVSII